MTPRASSDSKKGFKSHWLRQVVLLQRNKKRRTLTRAYTSTLGKVNRTYNPTQEGDPTRRSHFHTTPHSSSHNQSNHSINPSNPPQIQIRPRHIPTPRIQPHLHTPMHPNPLRRLPRNNPSPTPIPREPRNPRIIALLPSLPQRNHLQNPPPPTQRQLVVDGRQRIVQI